MMEWSRLVLRREIKCQLSHVTTGTEEMMMMMIITIGTSLITKETPKNSDNHDIKTMLSSDSSSAGIKWNNSLWDKQLPKYAQSYSSKNLLTVLQVYLLLFPCSQDHSRSLFLHLPVVAAYSQLAISSRLVSPAASSNHVTDANNNHKGSQRTTNSNCHHMAFWLSCWCCCWVWCCQRVAFLHYGRENRKISQSKNSWNSSCIYSD